MAHRVRPVVISIDDLLSMFIDYCGHEDFPPDAMPVKMLLNKQERKIAIIAESAAWQSNMPPLLVHFDLRRIHSVGGR